MLQGKKLLKRNLFSRRTALKQVRMEEREESSTVGQETKPSRARTEAGPGGCPEGYLKRVLVLGAAGRGVVAQGRAVQHTHGCRADHGGARPAATAAVWDICFRASGAGDNSVR